ncbi:unnamed protein product [Leptosia nina]|uniref:Uncharacterized protein n=1 Tax=Leptosia nina TaxID=320188 RepID=A0AAV1JZ23_9NEOP
MEKPKRTLEELLDLTDTESSSSSNGVYGTNQQFVLELHDLKKDDPQAPTEHTAPSDLKKKRRRKRAQPTTERSTTSTSSAASDANPKPEDAGKEEFYDASGSLHALPENQTKPTGTIVLAQAHSEHGQDPKAMTDQRTSATPRQPSTITKPVVPPDE